MPNSTQYYQFQNSSSLATVEKVDKDNASKEGEEQKDNVAKDSKPFRVDVEQVNQQCCTGSQACMIL